MKASVDEMEEAVTKAETTLDSSISMKKLLGFWFTGGKSRRSQSLRHEPFVPPTIFKTEELFPDKSPDEVT